MNETADLGGAVPSGLMKCRRIRHLKSAWSEIFLNTHFSATVADVLTDHGDGRAPGPGLRERKKRETRRALTDAALRLALERGMENVRVEDIAAAAGVSPRTFNNYFSSKYEALAARHTDRVRRSAEELRSRPEDEPLWEAIVHAVLSPFGGDRREEHHPDPDLLAGIRLMVGESPLRGETLQAAADADDAFAAAVAARTGTDPERDLYPRLTAAAVTAATQVAIGRWLHTDPPVPLVPLLREALRQLAAGLPDPSSTPPR